MRRSRGNMTPLTLSVALHSGVIRYSLIALCVMRAIIIGRFTMNQLYTNILVVFIFNLKRQDVELKYDFYF